MSDHTVRQLGDMAAIFHGAFHKAGAELEVSSFGMNVIEMPAGSGDHYPQHDHSHDGQEEVYVVLRGGGRMEVDGETVTLDPETMVRVGPGVTRKVFVGDDGMRLLVIGGIPGAVYERPAVFAKDAPDPTA